MEIIPDKRKLVGLVEQADAGVLCLPDFQRDFVWPRDQVADLVRSIVRRYFVGSLLLLRCDPLHPPFSPAPLQGANPAYPDLRTELPVLDGQQRLTALLYALTAPNLSLKDSSQRRWFYLDLRLLLSEPDNDVGRKGVADNALPSDRLFGDSRGEAQETDEVGATSLSSSRHHDKGKCAP
jgi:uncharacterized protein with ParB-like and HNH nuclease domain